MLPVHMARREPCLAAWGHRVAWRYKQQNKAFTPLSNGRPHLISTSVPSHLLCQYCHQIQVGCLFFLRLGLVHCHHRLKLIVAQSLVKKNWTRPAGWETKIFWHSPKLGSLLYSLYKNSTCLGLFSTRPSKFSLALASGRALVSQPGPVKFVPGKMKL